MKRHTFNPSRIKEIREAMGLTTRELFLVHCHNSGWIISLESLGNWERGENMPGADDLAQLARVLNVSITDFFDSEKIVTKA